MIAKLTEDTLEFMDIFQPENIPLDKIINILINERIKKIRLFFTPSDTSSYETILLKGEGTLFAMGKDLKLLESNEFMFPELSHT